jgi:hypothetical protein
MMKPIRYSWFYFYENYPYEIKNFYVICHHIFPKKLRVIKDLKNQANWRKNRS